MTDTVTYELSLSAEGGQTVEAASHFESEAIDHVHALIPKNSVPTTVDIQPGDIELLQGIIIIADVYTDLTFTVDGGIVVFTLDGPIMAIGAGMIASIFGVTLNELVFTNANVTLDRNITVLVTRTAIEPGD